LEILRVAAKNWNPQLEIFMIIKLVSDVNSRLHRQPSENEFNRKDEVKMFECEGIDLQTTICYLLSGGKWSEALILALVASLCAFYCLLELIIPHQVLCRKWRQVI